jgi:hypothetical protein
MATRRSELDREFEALFESGMALLPDELTRATRIFRRLRRQALARKHQYGAWLALEGLRYVSTFCGDRAWNLRICSRLIKEQPSPDAALFSLLVDVEVEFGKFRAAARHMITAIKLRSEEPLAEGETPEKRAEELERWRARLERIKAAKNRTRL